MARIVLGGLTTLNLATHLDPMFAEIYNGSFANMTFASGRVGIGVGVAASSILQIGGDAQFDNAARIMFSNNLSAVTQASPMAILPGTNSLCVGATAPGAIGGSTDKLAVNGSIGCINQLNFLPGASNPYEIINRSATGGFNFYVAAASIVALQADGSGNIRPGTDNLKTLGASGNRWSVVYAGTGTINTSDAREKTDVRPLTKNEIAAAKALCSEIGVFRFLASVSEKGGDARDHIGLTVQRAIEIMSAHGLSPFRYAFICHDKWDKTVESARFEERSAGTGIIGDDGKEIMRTWKEEVSPEKVNPAGDRYGFRYDQLALFIMRGLEARIAALEA